MNRSRRLALFAMLALSAAALAVTAPASAQVVCRMQADASQLVPPGASTANASGTFSTHPGSNQVTYSVVIGNIGADVATAAEVRNGLPGINGNVIFSLTKVGDHFSGTSAALTAPNFALVTGNLTYVLVKTQNFPNGAVRGQITTGQNQFWSTGSALEVVPPNASTALLQGLFSLSGNTLTYNVSAQALLGQITACHIANAAKGVNGPVQFTLTQVPGQPQWQGAATLTALQMAKLRTGQFYVIVRTVLFPAGECRGQISNAVTDYGAACASSNGVCLLDASGYTFAGGSVDFRITKARSNSVGLLLVSTDSANVFYKGSCFVNVKLPQTLTIPLATNATGGVTLTAPIPGNVPALNAFCQFGGADPGVVTGSYLSNGLQILIR